MDGPADQKRWINNNIAKLTGQLAHIEVQRYITELQAQGHQDIGHYLVERRNTIAHAQLAPRPNPRPVINPEDPEMQNRVRTDTLLMKALAELFIEQELNVKSRMTLWHQRQQKASLA